MQIIIDIPDSVIQGKEPTIIEEGIVTPTAILVTRWTTKKDVNE